MKTTGCVLDWRGGTRDWSRYHHTLVEHNTVAVRGVNGEAREFNGTNAYIDCGNDTSLDITDAITIEAWVKPNGADEAGYIMAMGDPSYNQRYDMYWRGDLDELVIYESGLKHESSAVFIDNNVWVRVCIVIDGLSLKFYRNGAAMGTATLANVLESSSDNLHLGNRVGGLMVGTFFNGTIDNVRIYNRALTPLEIWNNYVTMKPYIPLSESPVAIV